MTHRPSHAWTFTYKEVQIWVAIKTPVHTQLGLQPSVGLYSYSNVHTCVSPLLLLFALVVVLWMIRPKMLLGLDIDINTWLFHFTPYHSEASSTLLDTLPKQEEVAACPSLPTLPTDWSKTWNLLQPITIKSFNVSQDHPSGSLVTFDKCSNHQQKHIPQIQPWLGDSWNTSHHQTTLQPPTA